MPQERKQGTIKQAIGKVREAAGRVLGEAKTKTATKPKPEAKQPRAAGKPQAKPVGAAKQGTGKVTSAQKQKAKPAQKRR